MIAAPRFAVVFRTYAWDGFVARQLERCRTVSAGGDLFLSVDASRGSVPPDAHDRIFGTTDAALLALGLPDRFKQGSLVWWNNDYPQVAFAEAHPDYDWYVFVEYDSVIRTPLAPVLAAVAAAGIDMVAEPVAGPLERWFWWPHTRLAYEAERIRATINCVSILSRRALAHLLARRVAMGRDPSVRHWPISEAFVATEIEHAGLSFAPLSAFGDITRYDWFPPVLEDDLAAIGGATFVHPVLDPPRYLRSVLRHQAPWRSFFDPASTVRQRLARLPETSWRSRLPGASWHSFLAHQAYKREHRRFRSGMVRAW